MPKPSKYHQNGIQHLSKIDEKSKRRPGGVLGLKKVTAQSRKDHLLREKVRFWAPFWAPVDFGGGPKIAFLDIMLEKIEKKEVQERFQKKHEI